MEWGDWTQQQLGNILGLAANKKYVLDPQTEAAKWQALGEMGYYKEGQAGTVQQGTIPPTMLLLGLGLVVVLMLKD